MSGGPGPDSLPARWSGPVRLFHWVAALMVLAMLGVGLTMTRWIADPGLRFDVYQWHKSLGFCLLAVMLLRVLWRMGTRAPALPVSTPAWQRWSVQAVHAALYLLVFAMILSGWLRVSTSPLPVPTRIFGLVRVPNLCKPDMVLSLELQQIHAWSGKLLLVLVVLHVGAALWHGFIRHDGVLPRMLPFKGDASRINDAGARLRSRRSLSGTKR